MARITMVAARIPGSEDIEGDIQVGRATSVEPGTVWVAPSLIIDQVLKSVRD